MNTHFHAIIPAGGSGTRLWPLSRKASPKFLHDVLGTGRSLIQSTWDRVAPLVGPEHVWVVTGESHLDQVAKQLPEMLMHKILAEPSPKDSAAAIGLATMLIAKEDPEAIVGSFSADPSITNIDEF
ncbi:MAG: NTP transferase domain-containing protein, partial [Brevibacterium sp.]|nr:NTP transferase domain-containing protein [Brevibacterium sp.]